MLLQLVAPSFILASNNENNPEIITEFHRGPASPLVRMSVITGKNLGRNMLNSRSAGHGLKTSTTQLKTPEFIFGNLFGGLLGASLGSMIPLASIMGATGILAKMINIFPVLAGISIVGSLISESIVQVKEDRFSFSSTLSSIDWVAKIAGITGSAIGYGIGSLFLPSPFLGSFVASLLVGWLMAKLVVNCRSYIRNINIAEEGNKEVIDAENATHKSSLPRPIESLNMSKLREEVTRAYHKLILTADYSEKATALQEYSILKEELHQAVQAELISIK